MFTYNIIPFMMQEKSCKVTLGPLPCGGMKVAVNIRMPEDMKAALDKIAGGEFRSLNSLILQLLAEALKARGIPWREESEE